MIYACVKVHVCKMLTCNPLEQNENLESADQNYWFPMMMITFLCRNEIWAFHNCVLHFYCVLNRNVNNIIEQKEHIQKIYKVQKIQSHPVRDRKWTSCSEWMYLKDMDPLPPLDEGFLYFSSQTLLRLNHLSCDVDIFNEEIK